MKSKPLSRCLRFLLWIPVIGGILFRPGAASAVVVVGLDEGAGAQVRLFGAIDGSDQAVPLLDFDAFDGQFKGGVRGDTADIPPTLPIQAFRISLTLERSVGP